MKKAGFGWEALSAVLEGLLRSGKVDETPGRKAGSKLYFVTEPTVFDAQDGSRSGGFDAP